MIDSSGLKRLPRALLILALSFLAVSQGTGQSLSASGGTMNEVLEGRSYTLLPLGRADTTVIPASVGDWQPFGTPMTFTLTGTPGQSFHVSFSASNIDICNRQITVSFAQDALFWSERGTRLDPNAPQVVTCDTSGIA